LTEQPSHIILGGAPRDPDMPDYVRALYTNIKNTWQDAENLDDTHGYISYIWIPEETFKVDIMKLRIYAEKFRAYSKTIAAGGGTTVTSTSESAHRHQLGEDMTKGYMTIDGFFGVRDQSGGLVLRLPCEYFEGFTPWTGMATTAHNHDITLADHIHDIDFGIYEEAITGRTLSAILYDPDGNVLKDFGTILTGEDDEEVDLSSYFSTLKYGMYKLVLSASGRLRVRLMFYELCKMYVQT